MARPSPRPLLGELRHLLAVPGADAHLDGQLLDRYLSGQNEDAFALLVQRHGVMVLGVCRRVLQDAHDAEDAFQATFLALARMARKIRKRESVASWLHGAAYRVALKAKARTAQQHARDQHPRERCPAD